MIEIVFALSSTAKLGMDIADFTPEKKTNNPEKLYGRFLSLFFPRTIYNSLFIRFRSKALGFYTGSKDR